MGVDWSFTSIPDDLMGLSVPTMLPYERTLSTEERQKRWTRLVCKLRQIILLVVGCEVPYIDCSVVLKGAVVTAPNSRRKKRGPLRR